MASALQQSEPDLETTQAHDRLSNWTCAVRRRFAFENLNSPACDPAPATDITIV